MSNLRAARLVGPAIVAAVGVAMLCWTWGTWPDPITDFGKEVYLAWQLSLGQHLYSDVAYHLGPLPPYVNALAFKLFGPSLATILTLNLCVLALITALMYRLIRRIARELAAVAAGVVFMCLFAFTHFTPIVDYNFMAPYDHAHTHGLLLGLLALTAADVYAQTGKRWALAAAGCCLGLAFLTRAELFVAAVAGTAVVLYLAQKIKKPTDSHRSALFLASFAAPLLIALILLWIILPASEALRGFLGSWPIVFDHTVAANPFYRRSMGTDDIAASLMRMGEWAIWWAVVFIPPAVAGRFNRHPALLAALAAIWAVVLAYLIGTNNDFSQAFSPLPLAVAAALIFFRRRILQDPLTAGALVWALALLAKIVLNARIVHYGFALAMPATLLLLAIGIGWSRWPLRAAVLAAAAMVIVGYLWSDYPPSQIKLMKAQIYAVGEGPDQFWADPRGAMMAQVLDKLKQQSMPGQTLAVMPEGALLNFLAKMPNSTPYWSYNPPYAFFAPGQGEAAGEEKILQSLTRNPPDWVVLVAEDLSDFGTPFFGQQYGREIYSFVQANYVKDFAVGDPPFTGGGFGMILMRRVGYNDEHALPPG